MYQEMKNKREEKYNMSESKTSTIVHGHIVSVEEPIKYGGDKNLVKFRVRTEEQFPSVLEFTLFDKGIEKLGQHVDEGNEVLIKFNLKGKEFKEKIYHQLVPWSIEVLSHPAQDHVGVDEDLEEDVPF